MKIRGERECKGCGTRWSYYETGSVVCPECGSMESVGVDERKEHTATPARLDLSAARNRADEVPLADLADEVESACAEYVRRRGFVRAGELQPLDDTFLAAVELRYVASEVSRSMRLADDEEYYFLDLLAGADRGDRPLPTDVPESMWSARGLAVAAAVDAYRSDVRRFLADDPDRTATRLLGRLDEHRKRIEALDGDVTPRTAESVVDVARAVGRALVHGDESAFAEAENRLDALSTVE